MNPFRAVILCLLATTGSAFAQTKGFYVGLTGSADVYRHSPNQADNPWSIPALSFPLLLNGSAGADLSYVGQRFFVTTKLLYSTKRMVLKYGLKGREPDPIVADRTEATAAALAIPLYAGYVHRRGHFLLMPGIGVVFERKISRRENQKTFFQTGRVDETSAFGFRMDFVNQNATALTATVGIGYAFNRVLVKIEPTVRRYPHLLSNRVAGGSTGFHLPVTVSVGL